MSETSPQTRDTGDNDPAETEAAGGGEDESSTEKDGDDRHLHDDQKAPTLGSQ